MIGTSAVESAQVPGSVRSRGFTLSECPLTAIESIALECLKQIASEGRQATQPEICAAIGVTNIQSGTVPAVLSRLEQKGYITREYYQRGMMICIRATGQCTIPPANRAPHWRNRVEAVPTPAIQAIRERSQSVAKWMEEKARREGKSLHEFAMDCAYAGAHAIMAEEEE
jgi:hypothetical protein